MRYFLIKKEKLKGFLKAALGDYNLVAPQAACGGDFLFQEAEDLENIAFDYNVTSNTLKEFFFPRQEIILKYENKPGGAVKLIPQSGNIKRQTIFFGARSCDIRAVYFQDLFFARAPKDPLYWRRRDQGILISFACNKPARQSCFCALTKSGPFLEENEGFDLQLIDLPMAYLVEVGSDKGMGLVKKYKRFFIPAPREAQDKRVFLKENCLKEFSQKYDLLKVRDKLEATDLRKTWEALGKRCTNCAGCEFICPTCFCFYHQDIEFSKDKGERIRAWDSCTFSGYSRIAGDIFPHEKNSGRISRRFFCKLYNAYNWFKMFACTGCGRCSFVCPVNLDMESFVNSLQEGETYKPLLREL